MVARLRNTSWQVQVLLAWALTRVYTTALFLITAQLQGESYWNSARPDYLSFLNVWDVEWYWRIFTFGLGHEPGYPAQLPISPDGYVNQNAWAFMPGWPMLVRAVNYLVPLDWKILAPMLATALSFVFALLAYQVLRFKLDHWVSIVSVLFIGLWPGSAVLQTGYAESLALCLLAAGLYFLMQHRYLAALPFLAALSITRPGMVAFAMALAGMWLVRWFKERRGQGEFPLGEKLRLAALTLISCLLGFAWLGIAWLVTGRIDAYPATELAWRWRDGPDERVTPFKGLWQAATGWWGNFWFTYVLIAAALGAMAWLLFRPSVRALGNELRLWSASYLLYLALVFYPQSSTWRILLPAFPLLGALAHAVRRYPRAGSIAVVVALAAAQIWWFEVAWVYTAPDSTPP